MFTIFYDKMKFKIGIFDFLLQILYQQIAEKVESRFFHKFVQTYNGCELN